MKNIHRPISRYDFPSGIIQHAVGLYYRFSLSFHDIEDFLGRIQLTRQYALE